MIRVGVVRGGVSHKYHQSLETGATILQSLRDHFPLSYKPIDILITKDGVWHINGRPITADQLKESVDVVWNALHGVYGEDGALQAQLEALGIPYTGSGPVASALTDNPVLIKEKAQTLGLATQQYYTVPDYRYQNPVVPEVYLKEHAQEIFLKFSPPWVITSKQSPDIVAKTRGELLEGLRMASEKPGEIHVQQFVHGKPAVAVVTEELRKQPLYTFVPQGRGLTREEKDILQRHAKELYEASGLRHYGQAEFIVTPKQIYLTNLRTHPEISPDSHIHRSLTEVGVFLPEFIDHIIQLALAKIGK